MRKRKLIIENKDTVHLTGRYPLVLKNIQYISLGITKRKYLHFWYPVFRHPIFKWKKEK